MQIIDAFRQRVASDPSKTLIVDGSTSYSAEMVEALSDQLARELQQLAGSSVGIIGYLGWTSADCLITILAALKAGQCLVALDPANPSASLQDVINHAGVAQIVTAPRHLNLANQVFSGKILTVDAWAGDSAVPPPFEPVNVDPTAPAIITYTSGSTGKPKGAINTRAGLENRWNRVFLAGALEASDIVPFVSPWRFPEQLAAMALGIRQECFDFRALGPLAYADWLRERRITSLTSYLGVFRQLASVEGASFPDLKKYVVIGEPLLHADLELFNQRFSPGSFLQGRFGTSEHGSIAVYNYYQGEPIDFEVIPIGTPLEPETVRLLAPDGVQVPAGQQGEIVIASPVLADGYHNDAQRSAAVYQPDPSNPGRFLYHTGDLAYVDHLGRLRGLGRKDQQIKIRGYNVRPSEVEQIILEHCAVASVAVVPFKGPRDDMRLACHFVMTKGSSLSEEALRARISALVPSYQVPVAFLQHEALPVLANGKVNRVALPNPLEWQQNRKTDRAAPANETERVLVSIWHAVLGHQNIGVDEDFFDAGGDSLQAMSMLTDAEAKFGVRIPLETLILAGASVRALALAIDTAREPESARGLVEIKRGSDLPPLIAMHVVGGHLSDYLAIANHLEVRQPLVGIHPVGMSTNTPSKALPGTSVEVLAQHCAAVIRGSSIPGPYRLLGFSFGAKLAFETARQLIDQGAVVSHLILIDPSLAKRRRIDRLKLAYQAVRDMPWHRAQKRVFRTIPASLGLRRAPVDIDEAHQMASILYRARPLTLPRVLLMAAEKNALADVTARQWGELIGPGLTVQAHPGDHMEMIGQVNAFSLARKIEAWLADPCDVNAAVGPKA